MQINVEDTKYYPTINQTQLNIESKLNYKTNEMTKRSPTKTGQRRILVVNTHIHKVHGYYQFCLDEHGNDGLKQMLNRKAALMKNNRT